MSASQLSRRSFLHRAAVLAGAATVAPATLLSGARARASAGPSLVGDIDPALLVSRHTLWEWENFMVDLGPRFTGSPQHVRYLAFLEEQCRRWGLTTFHDPTQYFPRWDADYAACRLALLDTAGGARDLPVMSYFPGSGTTLSLPGGALVAPVVDAGMGLPQDFAAAIATGSFTGKIAFCTEDVLPTTDVLGYPYYYNDDPGLTMTPLTPFNKWSLNILSPQSLVTPDLAQSAGCVGMIIALKATATCARGQYFPFGYTVRGDQAHGAAGLPTLYVDYETGERIKARLVSGPAPEARMVLPARVHPNTGTDEIVAFLPGANGDPHDPTRGENIILASHTDGTSASEENGPLGMLALANYFSRTPRSQRQRTLVLVFATGHFTGYTKDTAWFTSHHPEILANTAASLTIEHLGQKSYTDDPVANTYAYDGFNEVGISYVSQDPGIIGTVSANYMAEDLRRSPVVNGPGFGVGTAFFESCVPAYAFITGPNTLYQMEPTTALQGTDPSRLAREVRTFARIVAAWDPLPAATLAAGSSAACRPAVAAGAATPSAVPATPGVPSLPPPPVSVRSPGGGIPAPTLPRLP